MTPWFLSWKSKAWTDDFQIYLSVWARFCCGDQNSNDKIKISVAYNHLMHALLTGLWVVCGSSGLGWTQAQACCMWLSFSLRSGGQGAQHEHAESRCWDMMRATSAHIHLVKISLVAKTKVNGTQKYTRPIRGIAKPHSKKWECIILL